MKIFLKTFTIISCLLLIHYFAYSQENTSDIPGITTRLLPAFTKSMAQIIAEDKPHTVPLNFVAKLRPEPEGPTPVQSNQFLLSPLRNGIQKSTPDKEATGTQSIRSNFLAIWGSYHNNIPGRESAFTPPDNCGDVGLTQIIATANTRLKVFDKPTATGPAVTTPTGNSTQTNPAKFNIDLNTFFKNPSLGINDISDPHVRFDRLTKRWFIVAISVDQNVNNYCCIAVSSGEVISSFTDFTFYYFSVSGTGGKANEFFDYPTLGVDKFALNIGGNMFLNSLSFAGCNMWVINKDSLIMGVLKVTAFVHNNTNTDIYTPQGVHNDDPNAVSGYFAGSSSSVYSKLVLKRVNHVTVIPTISADIPLNTIQTYGPNAVIIPQGDSIDGDDHRLCAAMIMKNKLSGNSSLWTAQGSLSDQSGTANASGDRDGIVWYEINNLEINPTIIQSSRIFDPNVSLSATVNYIYPTIAASGQGHNIMGFTSAGPSKYPQASVAGRYRTDPISSFQAPIDLTNASSRYNPGASRWGDFTQTVVDPSDNMTMWTFTQYADTINSWGVRAGQLIAPPPSTPKLETIPVCNTSTITVSGIKVNNSEFFDPGAEPNGPGFNRLKITVNGPSVITITNIVFVNQDTLRASFNLPDGTLAGTYTVTVTNPDGQTSSTNFMLAATCQTVVVTIVDFTGTKVSDGVQLNWITSNEKDIKNYMVEKSGDSINFQNFAMVNAAGNTTGNTNYGTLDRLPFPNFSYYRLKIYSNDGNFKYSKIIKVATDQKNIALTRLYPNPASSQVNLELFSTTDAAIVINVFDFAGRKMISETMQLAPGLNSRILSLASLARAGYVIQVIDANNSIIAKSKLLKQ